jgi:porin
MILRRPTRIALGALLLAAAADGAHAQNVLELEAALTIDATANVRGGAERESGWLANLDLTAALDGEAIGWPGGSAFVYLLGNTGDAPNAWVGDYQVTNNIEAPEAFRLFEAWVEQSLPGGRVSVLAGLRDLNAEFHVMEHGELFINSSMGIGVTVSQTGRNGPSIFPNSALSVRVQGEVTDAVRVRAAAWDAVANDPADPSRTDIRLSEDEGALLVGEVELGPGADAWRLVLGGFRYTEPVDTNPFDTPDSYDPARDDGVYGILEGRIGEVGDAEVHGFVHGGTANAEIYEVDAAWGGGVVATGLFGRTDDRLGVALAVAEGRPFAELVDELIWEATYEWVAAPWATVRLDGQWVDFEDARDDALILTTRFGIAVAR